MDVRTGNLVEFEKVMVMQQKEQKFFVPVERPLTVREQHRMKINKYAPCGCGSGKKFKFCCYKP